MAQRSMPEISQRIVSSYDPKGGRAASAAARKFEADQKASAKVAQVAHQDIKRSFLDMASSADSHLSGLAGSGRQAVNALANIEKSGVGAGRGLALGVGLGAVAAGAAIAAFAVKGVSDFVALADETRSLNLRMGGTVEQSSRLIEAGSALGVSSETLGGGFFKLSKAIAGGGKDFEKYGIEIAKTKSGGTDLHGTLLSVVDAFNKTSDPVEKDRIAFLAFGKGGAELIPILAQGREGLLALEEAAKNVMTQADIDKARQYEFAQKRLEESNKHLAASMGRELLPAFANYSSALATAVGGMDSTEKAYGRTKRGADDYARALQASQTPLIGGILGMNSMGDALNHAHDGEIKNKTALDDMRAAVEFNTKAMDEATKATNNMYNAQLSGVHAGLAAERAQTALTKSTDDASKAQDTLEALRKSGKATDDQVALAVDALKSAQDRQTDSAVSAADAAMRLAEDNAKAVGPALSAGQAQDVFRTSLEASAAHMNGPSQVAIQGIIDKLHQIPTVVASVWTLDASTGLAQLAQLQSTIQSHSASERHDSAAPRAAGGPVVPGKMYRVGERGEETVTFDRPGYVHPHGSASGGAPGGGSGQVINNTFYGDVRPDQGERLGRDIAWSLKT